MPDPIEGTPQVGAPVTPAASTDPPPITPAASAAPPAPPASPTATDADTVRMSSAKLKERLEESATAAQRKLLKDLGFEKPEDMKGALKRLKDLEDEKLTAEERTRKQLKELSDAAEAAKPIAALAKDAVEELFATLPEDQRKVIDETANGDPAERLRLIRFARKLAPPSTLAPQQPASQTLAIQPPPPAAPPSQTPPATTAPPPGAPRPGAVKTKWEQYQEMLTAGQQAQATIFYSLNERAIRASAPPQ